ncbi:MAG: Rieske 2Fe-2S domain-containing protein [Aigarchaeota archaeon]|nr:Rieske 2Fe-2S domain-containing protein [Candidatus Calditenuaceae archaeon]
MRGVLTAALVAVVSPFVHVIDFFYRREAEGVKRQKIANMRDLTPGGFIYFSYPQTGDPKIDNDPFRQFVLIMTEDGQLRVYSRVCVHLWCLPSYIQTRRQLICPCHGSIYREEDGVAIEGPAAYQSYPTNALPMGKIEVDGNGDIWMVGVDGRIGYGREWHNIKPDELVRRV